MRKLILLLVLLMFMPIIIGCHKQMNRASEFDSMDSDSASSYSEEEDDYNKDWPFPGADYNWIPSRDGLENSDTIVDGYPYNRI